VRKESLLKIREKETPAWREPVSTCYRIASVNKKISASEFLMQI
jgi:hypothetical protein